tara:strand:+ start:333 stop:941 length:609 start_codon:yes stop_codon:yes gene_type:complete
MAAVLGSSLFIICCVIIYYTLFYLKTYEETTQELFSSINNKAHNVSLSLFFVSLLVILYYLTLLDSESQVFGVPMIPGGLIIYMSLFIGLFGFYCLSICMKVASTEYPNDPNYEYAISVYNTLLSAFSFLLLFGLLTTTKNNSITQRLIVLTGGCIIVLHINMMHRAYWGNNNNRQCDRNHNTGTAVMDVTSNSNISYASCK